MQFCPSSPHLSQILRSLLYFSNTGISFCDYQTLPSPDYLTNPNTNTNTNEEEENYGDKNPSVRGSHGLSAEGREGQSQAGPKAGPKGRQLKVGARRASKLLVIS